MDQSLAINCTKSFATTHKLPAFAQTRVDRYYRERVMNTWGGGHIMRGRIPDNTSLVLQSNDYLGISRHPDILNSIANEVLQTGNGLLMSAVFVHGESPLIDLERRIANYMHAESSVICQSGWCANTGLIQVIANENVPVYIDMLAHTSLWEGIRSAGATPITIIHNDVEYLERQILKHGPGVVIVDSVYSTNGSVAPLTQIADICDIHNCILVVDESHSLGTHGPNGAGMVTALGLNEKVHFRTASLAKAFAARAGVVTCNKRFNEYFKCEANPAIFSSTLLPHEIAGLKATIDVIQKEDWRRQQLHANALKVREALTELGYNLNESNSQIVSLESGPEEQTITLRDALESRGVFGSVFCATATPKNRSLIRFSLNANLIQSDIERLIETCKDIRDEVGMGNWASTKRLMRNHSPISLSKTQDRPTQPSNAKLVSNLLCS